MQPKRLRIASLEKLAAIEYVGVAGSSSDCQDGVMRYVHYGDAIKSAAILTHGNEHGLLLTLLTGDQIGVKCGFASGYIGQGSSTFSYVLSVLDKLSAELEEYKVSEAMLRRLDASALLRTDLAYLEVGNVVRPRRLYEYIFDRHWGKVSDAGLDSSGLPATIPLRIIDPRISELALSFQNDPDAALNLGYRRLEDVVREKSSLTSSGTRLFASAFEVEKGPLHWPSLDKGEAVGRVQLFTGVFSAHRNPRAHRELKSTLLKQVSEFMLLNHLFELEAQAKTR